MANIAAAIQNTVSIGQFNKGLAGKIFRSVKNSGTKVVIKNNLPECVLMSPDEYVRLIDELEDAKLELLTAQRLEHFDPNDTIPGDEVMKMFGITEKDLGGYEEVELE